MQENKMKVEIRKFDATDIPLKVEWINNPSNNKFLHYNLPITIRGTEAWYDRIKDRQDRFDATILADDKPVGIIGLLNISQESAEFYITLGDDEYKGKGVAFKASKQVIKYAFDELRLKKVFLTTEPLNISAIKLYEKLGFTKCGVVDEQLYYEYTNSTIE